MGSSLSPIIADLVMQDLEVHIWNSLNSSLSIYYRYVDDILLGAHENDIKYIFNKFNNYHNRLKFTIEYEKNHCLSFLDLSIKTEKKKIIIDWFHKNLFGPLPIFLLESPDVPQNRHNKYSCRSGNLFITPYVLQKKLEISY